MKKSVQKTRRRLKRQYRILLRIIILLTVLGIVWKIKETSFKKSINSSPQSHEKNGKSQSTNNTEDKNLEALLKKEWRKIESQEKIPLSVAILYNGQVISYQKDSKRQFRTASIVKVSVATLFLHQNSQYLTDDENQLLSDMIRYSDNDSTTDLLMNHLGGLTSIDKLYKDLKMSDSKANAEAWGYTTTTAKDQVKLLNAIFNSSSYLSNKKKEYLTNLMKSVSSDQNWGVGSLSGNQAIKNGWLQDEDGWIVNSMGNVSLGDSSKDHYLIAVLTNENKSYNEGVRYVEKVVNQTDKILQEKKNAR